MNYENLLFSFLKENQKDLSIDKLNLNEKVIEIHCKRENIDSNIGMLVQELPNLNTTCIVKALTHFEFEQVKNTNLLYKVVNSINKSLSGITKSAVINEGNSKIRIETFFLFDQSKENNLDIFKYFLDQIFETAKTLETNIDVIANL